MKKTLIIFLTVIAIAGCKGSSTRGTSGNDNIPSLGGLTVPLIKNFTPAELVIAGRICESLEYKRNKMNQLIDNTEKFAFTGTWKPCNLTSPVDLAQYIVSISNSTADLRYVPASSLSHTIPDVVTNVNEPIKTLCTNITASLAVSNFIQYGGADYYFKIYNISGYDTYELAKRAKNAKGTYSLVSTQSVSIITKAIPNLDIKISGIEKFRTLNTNCTGNSDFTSVSHTWVGATTAYKLPSEL
ncbi:MAG: hypothetical protein H7336_10280 [Bacteriovorax sp.]|nr:hypothetical protein [Bacteriovorax sp.]